jgi:hypothetical protein
MGREKGSEFTRAETVMPRSLFQASTAELSRDFGCRFLPERHVASMGCIRYPPDLTFRARRRNRVSDQKQCHTAYAAVPARLIALMARSRVQCTVCSDCLLTLKSLRTASVAALSDLPASSGSEFEFHLFWRQRLQEFVPRDIIRATGSFNSTARPAPQLKKRGRAGHIRELK